MKTISRIGAHALWALVAAGCSDSKEPAAPRAESACRSMCAKQEQCDSKTDEQDCVEECEAQTGYSGDYWSLTEQCYQKSSCDELGGDLDDCIEQAVKQLDASDAGDSLCGQVATKAEACNGEVDENDIEQSCSELVVIFSDQLISDAKACLGKACDDVNDCLEDLEDEYRTDDVEDLFDVDVPVIPGGGGAGGTSGNGGSTTGTAGFSPAGSSGSGGSAGSAPVSGTTWLQPEGGHVTEPALGIQGWWWTAADSSSSILPTDFSASGSEICASGESAAANVGTNRFGAVVGLNVNDSGTGPEPYDFASSGISALLVKLSGSASAAPSTVRISIVTADSAIYCKEISTASAVGAGATVALDELVLDCWDTSSTSSFSGSANDIRLDLPPAAAAQSFEFCVELAVVVAP